jgi:hypothetical protein
VNPEALNDALRALVEEAGFRIRRASARGADAEVPLASGVCRVRDEIWVILADGDSLIERNETLLEALRLHAGPFLEGRFLPPSIREQLDPESRED